MHGRKLLYKRDHLDHQVSGQVTNGSLEFSKANNMLTCPLDFMATYNPINTKKKTIVKNLGP